MKKNNIYVIVGDAENSKRTIDDNGYLNVTESMLTKESVDTYRGFEIPNYENLRIENQPIEPNKLYKVYRPAEELKKSINLFNQLPILDGHYAFEPNAPVKDKIVGTVGSNAKYTDDGIINSMTFWTKNDAIDPIKWDIKRELSMGYTYEPEVQSGEYIDKDGNNHYYDIKMTNIIPNHLALVEEGRVRGAKVFDSKLKEDTNKMEEKDKREIADMVLKEVKTMIGDALEPIKEALEEKKEKAIETKVADTTPIEAIIKDALEKDKAEAMAKDKEEADKKEAEKKVEDEEKKEAKEEVKEVIGDSKIPDEYKARDIYKMALDSMGVNNSSLKDNELKIAFNVAKSFSSNQKPMTQDANTNNHASMDDYIATLKSKMKTI